MMIARFARPCAALLIAVLLAAAPAAAQTTQQQQPGSPVFSGVANMFSKETEPRPQTREEYRAAREARKEAEKQRGLPMPENVFFDESTGQWKKVVSGRSGGKYITATTCYEITHQTESSRVMRPVACIMPPRK
ncbi:MAG: hypothetical protein ACK4PK_10735 [Alphaproteobacteria bacterium]|jgi:hypothetical protein